jgi:hypothetical protein
VRGQADRSEPRGSGRVGVLGRGEAEGRLIPNRLRDRLKRVSKQLRAAADAGQPTLLVVYDNTPFKSYTMHSDVLQAMFGHHSVKVWFSHDSNSQPRVSRPFFGGNRGVGPAHNTAVSAIGVLEGGPTVRPLTIRLYHNPYARVRLEPGLFTALPVSHAVLPDAQSVTL